MADIRSPPTLRAVSFEADQAALVLTDPEVVVVPIVAVHGTQVPRGKVVTQGVPVVAARGLPSMLRALPAVLGPERVAALANQARIRFHAAAEPETGVQGPQDASLRRFRMVATLPVAFPRTRLEGEPGGEGDERAGRRGHWPRPPTLVTPRWR
jgi:hypothetical protein